MEFPKLLLHIGLILATVTDFCGADDPGHIHRLPTNSIPVDYNISLSIPDLEKSNTFHGETKVIVSIVRESFDISLHSQGLEVDETATTLVNDTIYLTYKPTKHTYDYKTNILSLHFEEQLYCGFYTLIMKFAGKFSQTDFGSGGFMKIPYTDEARKNRTLAATYLLPNKARRIFPCWDEPAKGAYFMISVRHHQKYNVLSNWPSQKVRWQDYVENDMKWTHFNRTYLMPTYLVGIVIVSNFVRVTNSNHSVNVWCRSSLTSQARFVLSIAERVTPLLEEYIGITKGVPKIDHVMVPNYPNGSMGDWGIIIYQESKVVYDDSKDPTFKKRNVASYVANGIAHQWFGTFITPSWWTDIWLNEGFAVYLQAYFLDKTFKGWRAMHLFVTETMHLALQLDDGLAGSVTLNLDDHLDNQLFVNQVRKKAPAILRMLHHAVGDQVFRKGITKYFATHQYTAVTPDDFWSAIQSAKDEASYDFYMRDQQFGIKEVMDTWIVQNRYPVLNVTMNYKTGDLAITHQKNFHATDDINNKWWIPISYAYEGSPYFSNTMPHNWLKPDETFRVQIITKGWIIVNLQQTAYCRVYYDILIYEKIIPYLSSQEYTKIHVLNRAQIIDDAYAFLLENQLDSYIFIDLITYYERERDYVAWRPMFRILKQNQKYFSLPESKGFKSYMVQTFDGGVLQHVGYEENPDDDDLTKLLRLKALKWACTVGHAECKRKAAVKLSEHFADPDTHKVPQWWQDWTYCFGLAVANRTTWDKMMALYQRTSDKKLWKILNCAEDPDIIINYLNITASNTTLFKDEQHALIFNLILQNHARNDLVLDYILANLNHIKRNIPGSKTINYIIKNVFSDEQMSKVKRFAETRFHQMPNILSNIIDLIEQRKSDVKELSDIFAKRFGRSQTLIDKL
ncbi:aminopeptidase M1-like [Temnothorax curvispinosus]|uniref:Aminopeptidase n=1 Tax=Temnothorax curvispinosus TaxID=300111 RepID=A0A6J1QC61_9HYME|nr:aminopeptidase M1-like [Temnothorax curvispinosus]